MTNKDRESMNDIQFNCPQCGQQLTVDVSYAGMTVACPKCGQVISVPQMARIVTKAEAPKPIKRAWIVASIGGIALLAAGVLIWQTHRRMANQAESKFVSTPVVPKTRVLADNSTSAKAEGKKSSELAAAKTSFRHAALSDWYVVLDETNGFQASRGVPARAIAALKDAQAEDAELDSFAFTPAGGWVLLDDNGFKTSSEKVPGYQHFNRNTKCVAFSAGGPWIILYRNGFWGPGSAAWLKIKELRNNGHEIRSVSFGPDGGFVVLYDESGVSYEDIPADLAKTLDAAVSNNKAIRCVAFEGWNWICLANNEWWASDTNLPAAKVIGQEFKHGHHPKWVALVPNSGIGSLGKESHIETRFKKRVVATLTTTATSPKTTSGTLIAYAPIPPELPMQHLVSCDIRCRNKPWIAPTTVADIRVPLQHYLRLEIPVTPGLLRRACVVDMTYVMDLYSAKLMPGPPQKPVATSTPPAFLAFTRESRQDDFRSPVFQAFLNRNGLQKQPTESDLHFAWRAWRSLHHTMHYVGRHDFADKASTVCQRLTGDCGDCAIMSVSALRANGLIAATLPGRWASEEGGSDYGQFHVFSAFFEPGIGWITFDVLNKFGSVPGNFIAFSLTDEDCPQPGIVRKLNQFQIWTYQGHSPFHPKYEDHWHVKVVSKK